jgi:dimethylhistidine N-methyltransferase
MATSSTASHPRADSAREGFLQDVINGLRQPQKQLPCKYFYDQAGSALFERITDLDEYYLTRTERAIMDRHVSEMAARIGPRCLLIEYGSGSSTKTRLLLDHLADPVAYVPIDISVATLRRSAAKLAAEYPALEVLPLDADFTRPLVLPVPRRSPSRRVVYFPGSTIGNFAPAEAVLLLQHTAELCGPGGGLLLGADLRKDRHVLEAAYDDTQGVTAEFNYNLLVRINRELGADFVLPQFAHRASYNADEGRIEMHLVSHVDQQVHVGGEVFAFAAGESIHTENSYKYSLEQLHDLGDAAGFDAVRDWLDERQYFSVQYFSAR